MHSLYDSCRQLITAIICQEEGLCYLKDKNIQWQLFPSVVCDSGFVAYRLMAENFNKIVQNSLCIAATLMYIMNANACLLEMGVRYITGTSVPFITTEVTYWMWRMSLITREYIYQLLSSIAQKKVWCFESLFLILYPRQRLKRTEQT